MLDVSGFIGAPFVDGGRGEINPHTGMPQFDCWGLTYAVYKSFGIIIPDYKISCFSTLAIAREIRKEQHAAHMWVRIAKPEAPALVVMRTDAYRPKVCNHLGVFVGNGQFIHTFEETGAVMERIDNPYWASLIEGFYRFEG